MYFYSNVNEIFGEGLGICLLFINVSIFELKFVLILNISTILLHWAETNLNPVQRRIQKKRGRVDKTDP